MSAETETHNLVNGALSCATRAYEAANDVKAKFDDIYNMPDPRAYYTTLNSLGYQIPTNAKPVYEKLIDRMGDRRPSKIVDIGCSYGVNAALLRHDMTFEELAGRYAREDLRETSVAEVIVADAETFGAAARDGEPEFIGLDVAREAVGYAEAVGLLDCALAEDLESGPLSPEGAKAVAGTDLVITTGAVGYVGAETFTKLIAASEGEPPWVAAFALRQFPFDSIAEALADFGMTTERLPEATFVQRRFRNREEMEGAIDAVRAAGRDPEGLETEGCYHAELYLARPRAEASPSITELELV